MKTNIIKLKLCILALTLICSVGFGQNVKQDSIKKASMKDSVRISKIKDSLYNATLKKPVMVDSSKSKIAVKVDSSKSKIAAKFDTLKKDVKVGFNKLKDSVDAKIPVVKQEIKETANKVVDKVTPSQPTEVVKVSTPQGNSVKLIADPTTESIFHAGTLIVGLGVVYQKEVLPIMIVGEYGIAKNIGVEVRSWYGSNTTDGIRNRDGLLGVGLNYHFTGNINNSTNASDKFDVYVGGLFGKKLEETGSAFYAQAGARYYFIKRLGAFANFNIGLVGNRGTNLSIGLAYSIFN